MHHGIDERRRSPWRQSASPVEASLPPQPEGYRRAAIYASLNKLDGRSAEEQLIELRDYAASRHWHTFSEYVDLYTSASKSRPELNRLLADADRHRFDVVVCWKLDRFGASLKHLLNALTDLDSHGVAFLSVRDNLDLSTPSGRVMFHIVEVMAERERSLIRERVKAGVREARRNGKTLGRPPRTLNFVEMALLREGGASLRQVAKAVGASPATVRTRLLQQRLRTASCNVKRIGRPPQKINVDEIIRMREQGTPVREIATAADVSPSTVRRRLMQQRPRTGLPNAKRGRPPQMIDFDKMRRMREQGAGFREIAKAVGVSAGTVRTRLLQLC